MVNLSSAVGFAAKLKPEIRLAQAISEFNASLSNKNQRAKFKNLQSQSPPSSDDIIRFTEEINRDGARAHRSWRPYGTRLVAILERMRQFAPIGDVMVGGSQNLIACGVWAVVRLSLEASLSFLSYFENVTSMMLRLGRSLSLHKDFVMLFPTCSALQSYMCEYTIVMVQICAKIVHNCTKSALSQLAASLTSTFDVTFKPLESDLATWAQLMEKRVTFLLAKSDLQSQESVLDRFNRLQVTMSRESASREKKERMHALLTSLCPDQGEFNLIWRRERRRGTSSWMYEQDIYKSWLSCLTSSTLWLKGNLGSGKTIAMASAAAHLISAVATMEPQGAVTVSYFFCQSSNSKTLSATALLGSITGQALQNPALEPSLMSFLEKTESRQQACTKLEDYIAILLKVTPANWRGIFVLDGLDEMPEVEIDDVFGQFERLADHRWIHLLCSSRHESPCYSIAKSHMLLKWTLSMETADRSDEIRDYIAAEISRWNRIRTLPTALEKLVGEQLLAGCQGMFLWLSLQIEDICPRYTQELRSDAEILDILGNLPKDLPKAFRKALSRVRDDRYGSKLFKLVASAEPPLNMDELRVACNVVPGNIKWDNATLSRSGKALISAYGGSLLDIDEEDLRVRFIHYSVPLHLTTPSLDPKTRIFHFDLSKAEQMLGAVCVTYLNYSVFENRISTAQKVSFGKVPQTTAGSVMQSEASRRALSLLARYRRQRDAKVDLERLSYELQKERWRVHDDVHLFLDYAKNQWLLSSRDLWKGDQYRLMPLWRSLVTSPTVSESLPWTSTFEAVTWALHTGHATLFQYYLHSEDRDHLLAALSAAASAVSTAVSSIQIKGEGLGWLAPLYLAHPDYQESILKAFVKLGCQPFKSTTAKCPSPNLSRSALAARVTKDVGSHMVHAFGSYSKSAEMKGYILFLANYWDDPFLVLSDEPTTLHLAIEYKYASLAHQLLSNGVGPEGGRTTRHQSPFQLSIRHNLPDIAQRLVESGADIAASLDDGTPLLFFAIDMSHLGLLSALLLRDASLVNIRYASELETAYHYLLRPSRDYVNSRFTEAALEAMVQHGADVNLRNDARETPLMLAVRMESSRPTEILVQNGANPNLGDDRGVRPLHYAQNANTIQHLLRGGAEPNAATVDAHLTPLMVAAHQGEARVVESLLSGGADPSLRISSNAGPQDMLILNWRKNSLDVHSRQDMRIAPETGATAFHLCLFRLEVEVAYLSRVVHRDKDTGVLVTAQLCSDLILIIIKLLRRRGGVGYQPLYTNMLSTRLEDVLSRVEKKADLFADPPLALDFIATARGEAGGAGGFAYG